MKNNLRLFWEIWLNQCASAVAGAAQSPRKVFGQSFEWFLGDFLGCFGSKHIKKAVGLKYLWYFYPKYEK